MKVIGFMASPRKGSNTDALLRQILEGAHEQGAETEIFYLNDHKYGQCQACYYCAQHDGECRLKDDMQIFYKAIRECDAFTIATPVYMGQMSGIAKIFFDRLVAFMRPDFTSRLKPSMKVLMAYAQAQPDHHMFSAYFKYTNEMFGFLSYQPMPYFAAAGVMNKGDLEKKTELMEEAKEAGRVLAGKVEVPV
ncbi:MAG: flavodoxin family protein [Candidatus Eremiobacteraeota bacterium]|nr:flavodoxin family protein [Candidatus Eremiobacteraeota bacterium]